ncbi:response regulator transcription factor [Methylobacterium nonmethylotrophicum]|uniref:Response regulator transcription factor n=1 Tax=Methylobacterium nonmethylotrophicum TaxID=1141884 RepID=A0A4Z0NR89_9HYPH|nr:response regulator [Methylobacterium nonmethylotrophicum]TGD99661.1 response regulator transcription factor [Methylobacterium nonmethylotrophicum]
MSPSRDGIVYVVDDDWRICEALNELMAASGLAALTFQSMADYLAQSRVDAPSCLVLDVDLPDINGLDFQEQFKNAHPPIVFITGYGDIPSSVRAIRHGAINFLTKPYDDAELLASIRTAIELDRADRAQRTVLQALRERYERLTPREREALALIVSGLLNKQSAAELGISEVTMQIHRSKIMQKMDASSLADLVRMADKLQIPINHSRSGRILFRDNH